ncbi:hypothetical protein TWF594_010306 [Orbilia oligospora]|nr:hypothetical protein TWF594_010306 [Orbilia oligospora]
MSSPDLWSKFDDWAADRIEAAERGYQSMKRDFQTLRRNVEDNAENLGTIVSNRFDPPTPLPPQMRDTARAKLPSSETGWTLEKRASNSSDKRVRKQALLHGLESQDSFERALGSGGTAYVVAHVPTPHTLGHAKIKGTQTIKHLGKSAASGIEATMYRDEGRRRGLSIPQTPFDDERSSRNLREGAIGQLEQAAKKLTPMSQLKSEFKHDMFEAVHDVAERNHVRFPRSKHVKGGMKTVYTTPDSMPLYNAPVLAPWYTDKPSGELEPRRDIAPFAPANDFKGHIFELYSTPGLTLTDIIAKIEREHNVTATRAVYKNRLKKWGFKRNTSRSEVLTTLREQEDETKIQTFRDPARSLRIEKYHKKNKIRRHEYSSKPSTQLSTSSSTAIVPRQISPPQVFEISERLGYEVSNYIKGSFEGKRWKVKDNQSIINSSPNQDTEVQVLTTFLTDIETGCSNFAMGNGYNGGLYWRKAFDNIEYLVRGDYHDHLLNIVITINDLKERGYSSAAELLKSYASQLGRHKQPSEGHIRALIYRELGNASLDQMPHLEEIIIACFVELFERYLGDYCYNSFVMHMNMARRRLRLGDWVDLTDVLPALSVLDHKFAVSDRRRLDVIRVRVETLFKRKKYLEVIEHSRSLVERAELIGIQDDPWQRHYFSIKGFYYMGMSLFSLEKYEEAHIILSKCFDLIEKFYTVQHNFALFDSEKVEIVERLYQRSQSGLGDAGRWGAEKEKSQEAISSIDNTVELLEELQIERSENDIVL